MAGNWRRSVTGIQKNPGETELQYLKRLKQARTEARIARKNEVANQETTSISGTNYDPEISLDMKESSITADSPYTTYLNNYYFNKVAQGGLKSALNLNSSDKPLSESDFYLKRQEEKENDWANPYKYTVYDGDTIDSIAEKAHVLSSELRRRNGIIGEVTPGQVINLPGSTFGNQFFYDRSAHPDLLSDNTVRKIKKFKNTEKELENLDSQYNHWAFLKNVQNIEHKPWEPRPIVDPEIMAKSFAIQYNKKLQEYQNKRNDLIKNAKTVGEEDPSILENNKKLFSNLLNYENNILENSLYGSRVNSAQKYLDSKYKDQLVTDEMLNELPEEEKRAYQKYLNSPGSWANAYYNFYNPGANINYTNRDWMELKDYFNNPDNYKDGSLSDIWGYSDMGSWGATSNALANHELQLMSPKYKELQKKFPVVMNNDWKSAMKIAQDWDANRLSIGSYFIPYIGTAHIAYDALNNFANGNIKDGLVDTGLASLGPVSKVGRLLTSGVKGAEAVGGAAKTLYGLNEAAKAGKTLGIVPKVGLFGRTARFGDTVAKANPLFNSIKTGKNLWLEPTKLGQNVGKVLTASTLAPSAYFVGDGITDATKNGFDLGNGLEIGLGALGLSPALGGVSKLFRRRTPTITRNWVPTGIEDYQSQNLGLIYKNGGILKRK